MDGVEQHGVSDAFPLSEVRVHVFERVGVEEVVAVYQRVDIESNAEKEGEDTGGALHVCCRTRGDRAVQGWALVAGEVAERHHDARDSVGSVGFVERAVVVGFGGGGEHIFEVGGNVGGSPVARRAAEGRNAVRAENAVHQSEGEHDEKVHRNHGHFVREERAEVGRVEEALSAEGTRLAGDEVVDDEGGEGVLRKGGGDGVGHVQVAHVYADHVLGPGEQIVGEVVAQRGGKEGVMEDLVGGDHVCAEREGVAVGYTRAACACPLGPDLEEVRGAETFGRSVVVFDGGKEAECGVVSRHRATGGGVELHGQAGPGEVGAEQGEEGGLGLDVFSDHEVRCIDSVCVVQVCPEQVGARGDAAGAKVRRIVPDGVEEGEVDDRIGGGGSGAGGESGARAGQSVASCGGACAGIRRGGRGEGGRGATGEGRVGRGEGLCGGGGVGRELDRGVGPRPGPVGGRAGQYGGGWVVGEHRVRVGVLVRFARRVVGVVGGLGQVRIS